jgi:copper resistance protein C
MMQRFLTGLFVTLLAFSFGATTALAHAFLDRAIPGVGASVHASPAELQLSFSQGIVPAFSSVSLATADGGQIPVGKPALDPGNPNLLHVRVGRTLNPGIYTVTWRVVSVDTHPTSGTYRFTIVP